MQDKFNKNAKILNKHIFIKYFQNIMHYFKGKIAKKLLIYG